MKQRARRVQPARDMDVTPFAAILAQLVGRLAGAFAAALVDGEGETVDYTGNVDPFDVKVAAAHARIVLSDVERYAVLGRPRWIIVRGARRSFVTHALPEGYALVVLLRRRAGFTASQRAFSACARDLAREAGWSYEAPRPAWYPVEVEIDARGRPVRVDATFDVEVIGSVVGLPSRERGFRVRTSAGSEVTLVREARNCWYADESDLSNLDRASDAGPLEA